jgi:hypothetical protein
LIIFFLFFHLDKNNQAFLSILYRGKSLYSFLSSSSVSSDNLSLCTSVHISEITALSSKSSAFSGSGLGSGFGSGIIGFGTISSSKFINFRKSSLDT